MSIDIIGTIYTAGEYDEQGNAIVAPEPLLGWHVITTDKLSGLDAHLSEAEPPRVFAGAKTYYYVFESEGQARELIGTDEEGNLTPIFDQPVTVPKLVTMPDLVTMRQVKLTAINEGKNAALDGGFVHDGKLFDSDSKARLAYLELSLKLSQDATYSTPWKASTGVWVTMDAALFAALQPAYEAHIQACFAWQAAREMEVADAVAAGDVEAMAAVEERM